MGVIWKMISWLVVWLPFGLFSQKYWESHHPNWLSYFSEGWPNHQPEMIGGFYDVWQGLGLMSFFWGFVKHITKTNICWRLDPQESGDVKHWDIETNPCMGFDMDLFTIKTEMMFFVCSFAFFSIGHHGCGFHRNKNGYTSWKSRSVHWIGFYGNILTENLTLNDKIQWETSQLKSFPLIQPVVFLCHWTLSFGQIWSVNSCHKTLNWIHGFLWFPVDFPSNPMVAWCLVVELYYLPRRMDCFFIHSGVIALNQPKGMGNDRGQYAGKL